MLCSASLLPWHKCQRYDLHTTGWRSLLQRRADNRLFMLYKIVNGIVTTDFSDELVRVNRVTRHSHPYSFYSSICNYDLYPAELPTENNQTMDSSTLS